MKDTPQELLYHLAEVLRTGDVTALATLYEPGAVLDDGGSKRTKGAKAIAEDFAKYSHAKPEFTLLGSNVIENGDVALIRSHWRVEHRAGPERLYEVRPTVLARKQPDGTWKIVIDCPSAGHPSGGTP